MIERDDTNLTSLICPHCKGTIPNRSIDDFIIQQLIYQKCPHCDEGITEEQITNTYREYANRGY